MSKPRYLTKSRFKQALECPDKLYYTAKRQEYGDSRDENEFLRELAKGGIQVGELAKCYFPDGVEVETLEIESAIARTQELMQQDNVTIFEAAIVFENLLVRVDVLEKKGNLLNLYEAKSKSYFSENEIFKKRGGGITAKWKPYVYDIAFQVFVTRKAFPKYSVNGSLFLINKNLSCTVEGLYQKFLVRKLDGRYKVISNPDVEIGNPILCKVELGNKIDDILLGTEDLLGTSMGFGDYVEALSKSYMADTKLNTPVSVKCKSCEYKITEEQRHLGLKSGFEECWIVKAGIKQADFAKPHIFEIWNFRKSSDLIDQRRYFIADLNKADFEVEKTSSKRILPPHERQWLQVERVHNPSLGPYYDKSGLQVEFKKLKYPIHFIDFEATRNAIPYLKGLRPYSQLAFQFSRHTIDSSGNISHGEWLETGRGLYPNFNFVRNLKNQIGNDSGSVLIYSSYENSVLVDIHDNLSVSNEPDKGELMGFIKSITWSDDDTRGVWSGARKMIDMKDWVMDFYYSSVMKGSNSIKIVLPAIIKDSKFVRDKYPDWIMSATDGSLINPYKLLPPVFDNLDRLTLEPLMEDDDISDGGAAMCAFNLMQFSEMSDEEKQKITQALLKYCHLDTLAMVMLFEGLSNFGN
ncbi:MAG: DUF2779 domain-containing protein [Cyclobacteriaceae bacterium]|nr:DUF2779 domain-containing protein [Cyclobacteriaceae bacterium]